MRSSNGSRFGLDAHRIKTNTTPTVIVKDGEVFANSRDVADFFGKLHKDVLRAIDNLECSDRFRGRNFALTAERIQVGAAVRTIRSFNMTKDGFAFLVMGFTGKDAARFKEAYIQRFNEMEAELHRRPPPQVPTFAVPTNFAEALQLAADQQRQLMIETERNRLLETENTDLTAVNPKSHSLPNSKPATRTIPAQSNRSPH